ncbi:2-phospho-L-lactate guanylyltransferase [Streptomyces peucetius]|uniref:Phosphoenolpyruvate guanylyltransferase n=1 Tax=Streptomyces peucetius TaxID=1950 RepID=A0ABY6ICA5_STRPE|nr:2-phospho-L-lactate guanylyltransferase [Streptomyces peucetius]UYQ64628.1 2-phospho-L-lactate guanylyltransferase [Streptomyces peucetius]
MRMDSELAPDTKPVPVPALLWSLVVPLKPLALAKSRLAGAADGRLRPRLALAFAQDTVAAALACSGVRDVVVVTDDRAAAAELAALGARIVPDAPAAGLNAALAYGAGMVRSARPSAAVAALNADLPALRSAELGRALTAASVFTRAFLTDAAGIGTTLLCARPGSELRPAFGGPSRRAHLASGAVEIASGAVDSVRQDVDTADDLAAALALGVGPHTARRLAAGARTVRVGRRAESPPAAGPHGTRPAADH